MYEALMENAKKYTQKSQGNVEHTAPDCLNHRVLMVPLDIPWGYPRGCSMGYPKGWVCNGSGSKESRPGPLALGMETSKKVNPGKHVIL